jgi:hypothetical protein
MDKVKLSVDELQVESFAIAAEDERGTVNANEVRPTAPTRDCPCDVTLTCVPVPCGS